MAKEVTYAVNAGAPLILSSVKLILIRKITSENNLHAEKNDNKNGSND